MLKLDAQMGAPDQGPAERKQVTGQVNVLLVSDCTLGGKLEIYLDLSRCLGTFRAKVSPIFAWRLCLPHPVSTLESWHGANHPPREFWF